MFPNDDICNRKAAKDAAKRIFERYKEPSQGKLIENGLGDKQVSNLIKNAYQAINITYDPSTSDVSSFMSVFGVGQNGRIDLEKIQEMAVKYLCGEDELKKNTQMKQKQIQIKSNQSKLLENLSKNQNTHFNSSINQIPTLPFSPKANQFSQFNLNYQSPKFSNSKNQFFPKQNTKTLYQSSPFHNIKKPSYTQVMKRANEIFHLNKNLNAGGITIKEAPKIITMTYELIGRANYNPTQEDVKIWMKLCDPKRTEVIDWANYQVFLKRLLERENIKLHP